MPQKHWQDLVDLCFQKLQKRQQTEAGSANGKNWVQNTKKKKKKKKGLQNHTPKKLTEGGITDERKRTKTTAKKRILNHLELWRNRGVGLKPNHRCAATTIRDMMQTRLQKPKLGTKAEAPNPRKSADGLEGITDTYCDRKQRKKGRMATAEEEEEKENARVRGRAARVWTEQSAWKHGIIGLLGWRPPHHISA
jgi:hypothetical protein